MFSLTASAQAAEPEDGWWWDPAASGMGLNLEVQGQTLLIAYFDEIDGVRVAYNGVCTLVDSECTSALLEGTRPTDVTIRLRFPENSLTGTAHIAGRLYAITRFEFNPPIEPLGLIGRWDTVVLGVNDGANASDTLILRRAVTLNDGSMGVEGTRQSDGHVVIVQYFPNDDEYVVLIDEDANATVAFVLDRDNGLNQLSGSYVVVDQAGSPLSEHFPARWHRVDHRP